MWRKYRARERIDEQLSAYIDGALSPREWARLEKQLAGDPALRARLDTLRQTVALVRGLPPVRAPRNFLLTPRMVAARPTRPVPHARRLAPALTFATAISGILCALLLVTNLLSAGWGPAATAPMPLTRQMGTPIPSAAEEAAAEIAAHLEDTPGAFQPLSTGMAEGTDTPTPPEVRAVPGLDVETPSLIESALPGTDGSGEGFGEGCVPPCSRGEGVEETTEAEFPLSPSPIPAEETQPAWGALGEKAPPTTPPATTVLTLTPESARPERSGLSLSSWLPVGGLALLTLALAFATLRAWRAC